MPDVLLGRERSQLFLEFPFADYEVNSVRVTRENLGQRLDQLGVALARDEPRQCKDDFLSTQTVAAPDCIHQRRTGRSGHERSRDPVANHPEIRAVETGSLHGVPHVLADTHHLLRPLVAEAQRAGLQVSLERSRGEVLGDFRTMHHGNVRDAPGEAGDRTKPVGEIAG